MEIDKKEIIDFLETLSFLNELSRDTLTLLAEKLQICVIESNQILFEQNDEEESLYFIYEGRFSYSSLKDNGEHCGQLMTGELIGEIAFLIGIPRTATIRALRDSILLKLAASDFSEIINKDPIFNKVLTRYSFKRFVDNVIGEKPRCPSNKNIFLVTDSHTFIKLQPIIKTISESNTYLNITHESLMKEVGPIDSCKTIQWIHQQEHRYDYILFYADQDSNDAWLNFCMRAADIVIFFKNASENKYLSSAENLMPQYDSHHQKFCYLILLHENIHQRPTGTAEWLSTRPWVDQHFHIHLASSKHQRRLVRIITSNTRCLMLSSGAAMGYVHFGLLRAFEELNIEIDYVIGCSIGAIIGAIYCSGINVTDLHNIKNALPIAKLDLTFPYFSITKGYNATYYLQQLIGADSLIEDLWERLLIVTTNFTKLSTDIKTDGLLWKWTRASFALPAIYPPIVDNNQVYIDGVVINDLPVGHINKLTRSHHIYTSVVEAIKNPQKKELFLPPYISGWKVLFNNIFHLGKKYRAPTLFSLITQTTIIGSQLAREKSLLLAHKNIIHQFGDFREINYENINFISEKGYQNTLAHFQPDAD